MGWIYAVLAAPILIAYSIMSWLAVDIPHIDDYFTVLGFSVDFERLPTLTQKLNFIVSQQYLEYKFVFMHMIVAAEISFTHHLNFAGLGYLGNLFFLPLLYLLWQTYFTELPSLRQRLLLFIPVTYILFGINYGEGLDWPSSTLDYLPSIYFSLAAIHYLVHSGTRFSRAFTAACLLALLAYFSAVNSFLLGPLGFLLLALRRAYLQAVVWCAVFALGFAPYLYRYTVHPPLPHGSIVHIVLFFLSFVGAGVSLYKVELLAGPIILAICFVSLRTGHLRTHLSAVLATAWILGSAMLTAIGRSHALLRFSHPSRYQIFSDLLLIYCYAYVADRVMHATLPAVRKRQVYQAAVAITLLCWLGSDVWGAHILYKRRTLLWTGIAQYRAAPDSVSPLLYGNDEADHEYFREKAAARVYMQDAIRTGLYTPPATEKR